MIYLLNHSLIISAILLLPIRALLYSLIPPFPRPPISPLPAEQFPVPALLFPLQMTIMSFFVKELLIKFIYSKIHNLNYVYINQSESRNMSTPIIIYILLLHTRNGVQQFPQK